MKILRLVLSALVIVAATASTVHAHDSYSSVGITVGNDGSRYGYGAPIGYSSDYVIGYSQRPVYPTVVYYGAPTRCYQPVVVRPVGIYGDNRYHGVNNGYRVYDNHHWGRGHREHHGWGYGHRGHDD